MYKNIICFFSFPFICQNVRMRVLSKRESKKLRCTHRGRWYGSSVNCFPIRFTFRVEMSLAILYSGRQRKFSGNISFNLLLSRCTWKRLFLICHPCNLHREHLRSIQFWYQVHFLLFLLLVSNFCSCIGMSKVIQVNIQQLKTVIVYKGIKYLKPYNCR